MTDVIAERARKIGGTTIHSISDIARNQRLKDNNKDSVGARDAGALGPDRVMTVIGIGGLGAYAVQHAKLYSSGANVLAFGNTTRNWRWHKSTARIVINIKGKAIDDIRAELKFPSKLTKRCANL